MKKKIYISFILFLFLSTMAIAQQWEYLVVSSGKILFYSPPEGPEDIKANLGFKSLAYNLSYLSEAVIAQKWLDRLGQDDWELITVVGSIGGDQELIFKRPYNKKRHEATLKKADDNFKEILKNLTNIVAEEKNKAAKDDKTKLIEYDSFLAQQKKLEITEEKEAYIKSKMDLNKKYKISSYQLYESTYEEVPDSVIITIDATKELLFDGNKYKKSKAEQLLQKAKKYFSGLFENKYDPSIYITILYNGKKYEVVNYYDSEK